MVGCQWLALGPLPVVPVLPADARLSLTVSLPNNYSANQDNFMATS